MVSVLNKMVSILMVALFISCGRRHEWLE